MVDIASEQEMIKLLINRTDKIDEWMLEVKPEYFTDERRHIFNCMQFLRRSGTGIDYITLSNELKKHNKLDLLRQIKGPKDHSKLVKPRQLSI